MRPARGLAAPACALRRAGEWDAAVADVDAGRGGFVDEKAEVGERRKDFRDGLAGKSGAVASEEFVDRAGSEDHAAFAVEDEDGVFEIAHQAVHVAAEVGDFELRAAQAFAQEADLGGHDGDFVIGGRAGGAFGWFVVAGCEEVELAAQAAQRAEGEGGKQERDANGADDRDERDVGALIQSRLDGIANQGGGHDDAHKELRRAQFLLDLEVSGVAAQQHAQLFEPAVLIDQRSEIGIVRAGLPLPVGEAVGKDCSIRADDGDFDNHG